MLIDIHSLEDIKEDNCIIFKHSITCPVSAHAKKIVDEFVKNNEEIPVYICVVQTDEQLKLTIAQTYGIKHESPQVIILKEGKVVASANHYHIENLEQYF